MTRRSGEDALGALCRALDGRDVRPLAARLDDASSLHVAGRSGLGGDYQGHDAIVGLLERMAAATDGTLRFEVERTSALPAGVVRADGRLSGSRDGRPFRATVSVEATLAGETLRRISIECAERPAWEILWG